MHARVVSRQTLRTSEDPGTIALSARRSWRSRKHARSAPSSSPSCRAGVAAPRTSFRRSMTSTAGRSASWRRRGSASISARQAGSSCAPSWPVSPSSSAISFGTASSQVWLPPGRAGIVLGRQEGQRPSDKKAKKVLVQHRQGLSYRLIGRNLGLSKNTVMEMVKREAG